MKSITKMSSESVFHRRAQHTQCPWEAQLSSPPPTIYIIYIYCFFQSALHIGLDKYRVSVS